MTEQRHPMSINVEALRREVEALPVECHDPLEEHEGCWTIDRAAVLAILARLVPAEDEGRLREIAYAADALVDELDPDAHPLSDHYRSQAEARLRKALADWRAALAATPESRP